MGMQSSHLVTHAQVYWNIKYSPKMKPSENMHRNILVTRSIGRKMSLFHFSWQTHLGRHMSLQYRFTSARLCPHIWGQCMNDEGKVDTTCRILQDPAGINTTTWIFMSFQGGKKICPNTRLIRPDSFQQMELTPWGSHSPQPSWVAQV